MKFTQTMVPATFLVFLLANLAIPAFSQNLIPADKTAIPGWMTKALAPTRPTLDPALVAAEKAPVIIHVRQDGTGQFKTINEAVNSVPMTNTVRTIIWIGPGVYNEKVIINATRHFITFYATPGPTLPKIIFDGTAAKNGVLESATLIVMANYFMAVNIVIENSSPEPDGKMVGAQAAALRVAGDKAAFYNCRILGFQDTLADDKGCHFFKDCFIQGTVDFIFGSGTSIYLGTEIHSLSEKASVITAQARKSAAETNGYSFVHCLISGAPNTYLGRAWMPYARVVFLYTEMGTVISKEGWEHMAGTGGTAPSDNTVFFGEFQNTGAGADITGRAPYVKKLLPADANTFLDIAFINGTSWLLPPPSPK